MKLNIDFASREYKQVFMIRLLMLFVSVILAGSFLLQLYAYKVNAESYDMLSLSFSELKREEDRVMSSIQGGEKKIAAIRANVRLVNSIIFNKSFSWSSFLSRFEEVVPDTVLISAIVPKGNKEVLVSGKAYSLKGITNFIIALEESTLFLNPFLKENSMDNDKLIGFSIVFGIKQQQE